MISFYDKWYFISFKVDIISIENVIVTDGIITLCNMWSYDIYDMALATE